MDQEIKNLESIPGKEENRNVSEIVKRFLPSFVFRAASLMNSNYSVARYLSYGLQKAVEKNDLETISKLAKIAKDSADVFRITKTILESNELLKNIQDREENPFIEQRMFSVISNANIDDKVKLDLLEQLSQC